MNTDAIVKLTEAIAADVVKLFHQILDEDSMGTNSKTGKNTLRDSAMNKNIRIKTYQTKDSIVIETLLDNYIDYIEQGRKPRSGKQPPIDALRDWALARGIPTDNSTLFLIGRAIWRDGYEGRPIMATLEDEIEKAFDERWAEQLLEVITDEFTKYFNE
ncbi:hypothetical protein M2451_004043 [Dysgonomonas sp. PFB1-18]|uniref:hypothetical protein n=1 Tax=unclassified Dysgonomonas TaxID=2630389 RepID=UPI0024742D70|nr:MULTISPECIES: hypothetical protein [unclassified Dysgonomonas]MDH6311154.1 hypothetical protein [Dysgonomonas sp. PF1-14]MDH6340008.1 hypothetical protein [Dysgonomonas sp. PF1-16]MDH6382696.1 hypothetical protein [Dysgonomonas sp. PFB1-18]MDH6398873.1 hypothetical protein [Dysgonomonas sp. PF1-23]